MTKWITCIKNPELCQMMSLCKLLISKKCLYNSVIKVNKDE